MSKYPFQVMVSENPPMKAYDMHLVVGGFPDQDSAEEFAQRLVEFMAREANAKYARVQ